MASSPPTFRPIIDLEALVLDIGNVLLPFDFSRMARRAAEAFGISPNLIHAALDGLVRPFETGQIAEPEFFERLATRLGAGISPTDLRTFWCDIFEVNEPMVAFLRASRATGLPVYLLSNTNSAHARFFELRHPFILETEGRVYSHEEGVMKPDPLIFQRLIERFNIQPARTLYVDDLPVNVEAARALGFHALIYNAAHHREFLDAAGGLGLPR